MLHYWVPMGTTLHLRQKWFQGKLMFLLSYEKKIHPHTQYRCGMILTHVCLHSCAHIAPRSKYNTTTHTQVIRTYCSVCHTGAHVQTRTQLRVTQLKYQHHLEVKIRHCSHLTNVLKLLFVSLLWISFLEMFSVAWFVTTNDFFLKAIYWEKGHLQPQVCRPWIMSRA